MKLDEVKVIDFSMFLPGPHLTQMMGDHGAEVIRVEAPPDGEPARKLGPVKNGHTPWFRNTHRGKKSLCVNLKDPVSKNCILQLCETMDVFVESFRPGVTERLGLDYAKLSEINPRIIYCSITAFGQYGSYKNRPAHDLSIEALSGLLSVNLGNDKKPVLPGVPAADMAGSLMGFGAVMMALYRREKTGQGDYIDISMQDSLMGWTQNVIGPVFAEDKSPEVKLERGWGGRAFYNIYQTSDGRHLTLSGNEPRFVENLLQALKRPDLIELALSKPGAHQKPLIEFLSRVFKEKTLREWNSWFLVKDVCYGPVLDMKEAFEDRHVKERNMLVLDEAGNKHIGIPIKFKNEPGQINFDVPDLNADADSLIQSFAVSSAETKTSSKLNLSTAEKSNE